MGQFSLAKKRSIVQAKENLIGLGRIIQQWNLHQQYATEYGAGLNQLFSIGYDATDGKVSWQEAVNAGWAFAKAIAKDTKPVLLKAFESQTWGMFRGMMVKQQLTMTTEQSLALRAAIEQFSWNYVRSRPFVEEYSQGEGGGEVKYSFTSGAGVSIQTLENAWMGKAFGHLQELMQGMTTQKLIQGLEYSRVLLDASARTVPFMNYGIERWNPSRNAGPLRELIELGFELSRVGATNPEGLATEASAWIEAVLEGNVKVAAEGFSQFAMGLEQPEGFFSYADDMRSAIDYAQRLVQVAGAVDDPVLDVEVLKADVLSELVNLGGAYTVLNPGYGTHNFFLHRVLNLNTPNETSNELENFLQKSASSINTIDFLRFQSKILTNIPGYLTNK